MNIRLKSVTDQPVIQVNTFRKQKHLDLEFTPGEFLLYDLDGNLLFEENTQQGKWRVKVKQAKPPLYEYFLILKESSRRQPLEKELARYNGVIMHHVGGQIIYNDDIIATNDKYLLIAGPFASQREARHHSQDYAQINHCHIFRQISSQAKGSLEIFDPYYEVFAEVKNGIQLVPQDDTAYFKIKHYAILHAEEEKVKHKDLFYQGKLNIKIDEENTLLGINEVGVETYLKGVLHSEIGEQVEVEFAKSMAIVARSQIFARIGQMHAHEGFDFCSDSHCMRYYGRKVDDQHIDSALKDTKGMILITDKKVCDAYFSYSCGGHMENASGVWLKDNENTANHCGFDTINPNSLNLDLQSDNSVKKWILDRPDVLCKTDSQKVGGSQKLSSDAFRWEMFYTRNELEAIIYEKTGEELGIIYEIIPIARGASGRIREVEILSSLKNIKISGELNIRSALSVTLLNSSCFFVEAERDMDGVPINFTLIGAGKGHGVGLCKVGAAKMSMLGKNYTEILAHYFKKCDVKRIY